MKGKDKDLDSVKIMVQMQCKGLIRSLIPGRYFYVYFPLQTADNRVVERRPTPDRLHLSPAAALAPSRGVHTSWSDAATELSLKPAPLLILSLKCT